jgi:hypothetical protein
MPVSTCALEDVQVHIGISTGDIRAMRSLNGYRPLQIIKSAQQKPTAGLAISVNERIFEEIGLIWT